MKILILGSTGMLGTYLCDSSIHTDYLLDFPFGKRDGRVDYLKPTEVILEISRIEPDVVINCVAITSFDYCENFPKEAEQVNSLTPGLISNFCFERDIYFIHVSTDHFYVNDKNLSHPEDHPVEAINHYAKTKYDAEKYVLDNRDALVLRTSIIGRNSRKSSFLDWLLDAMENNKNIDLFEDAYTSFIHCSELSSLIFQLIEYRPSGLFNLASNDVFSKADFAIALARQLKFDLQYKLKSVDSLMVKRANSCGLDSSNISALLNINLPTMADTVHATANEFIKKG